MAQRSQQPTSNNIFDLLRDTRFLQIVAQIIFVIVLAIVVSRVLSSIFSALQAQNLTPNFSFLQNRAGFDIGESPEWYSSNESFLAAYQVGLINTLRVISVGLVLTTILGILVGIFLLSTNWLLRTISRAYVEFIRNVPLLLQLFAWYFIVMFTLPVVQQSLSFPSEGVTQIALRLLIYIVALYLTRRYTNRLDSQSRRAAIQSGLIAAIVVIEAAFWLGSRQPDWAGVYARGDLGNGAFLLYFLVSALLIVAASFTPPAWRALALGSSIGQLVGGLLFYFGIIPNAALRTEIYPWVYVNIRGFVFPELLPTARFANWMAFIGVGVALAFMLWIYFGRVNETTGKSVPRGLYAALALVGFALLGWFFITLEPAPPTIPIQQEDGTIANMTIEEAREAELFTKEDEALYSTSPILFLLPQRAGLRFNPGTSISPEYMAMLLGLVVYTSSFIAEIVRAGIQAVPRGQIEASRALGFNTGQMLRMIILPQALRVIIPPLGNQYLNLAKNSSLGLAIAYADLFQITTTIMNTSGQSVTGITMVMVTYLVISLTISAVMNWVNRRFQLVTR
jgi:His/Glu/Gln/Arg/opine family amino acid ABC transporter permease subunit